MEVEDEAEEKNATKKEEDLTHLVVAAACIWEMVLRMNSGGEDPGPNAIRRECYLPRVIPPLLYPLQAQIASWLEHLREATDKNALTTGAAGDNSTDASMRPQVVHALSWLEFIVTLNTCAYLSNAFRRNSWIINIYLLIINNLSISYASLPNNYVFINLTKLFNRNSFTIEGI